MKTSRWFAVVSTVLSVAACSTPSPSPSAGGCGGEGISCADSATCCGGYYCSGGRCALAGGGDSAGSSGTSTSSTSGGASGGSEGGGSTGGGGTAPCALQKQDCAAVACCSGVCNGGSCDCTSVGGNCGTDIQCCSGVCVGGVCAACNAATALCDINANCCSGNCLDGVCACAAAGIACASASDCCSGTCDTGVCQCAPVTVAATGTFTDSASGVSATVTVQLQLSQATGGAGSDPKQPQYELLGGRDAVTFTSPTDASQVFFDVDGAIPSAAVGSYTSASGSNTCGLVSLTFKSGLNTDFYQAQTAAECNNPATQSAAGSWALTVTSSSEACSGGNYAYYAIHGTLTATMPEVFARAPATGTLSLSF